MGFMHINAAKMLTGGHEPSLLANGKALSLSKRSGGGWRVGLRVRRVKLILRWIRSSGSPKRGNDQSSQGGRKDKLSFLHSLALAT